MGARAYTLITFINHDVWPQPYTLRLQFDPRDFWIGLFWSVSDLGVPCVVKKHNHNKKSCVPGLVDACHFYLCLIPFLPIHFMIWRRARPLDPGRTHAAFGSRRS